MQEYLTRTRLGTAMDHLGSTAALLVVSLCFYVYLWGARLSAILAGTATFLLLVIVRERTRRQRLKHRETLLRRRIGGELKLEQWLVMQPRRANLEAALLLSQLHDMELERALEEGVVCKLKKTQEQLLIACVQLHAQEKLTARDVAAVQRACLREKAARGVLCGAGGTEAAAQMQAKTEPRITLIGREKMIALAGAAWPATDEQLVELGKRKRVHPRGQEIRRTALQPERAQRYLFYGLLLCLLYFLLGSWFYLLPGCLCFVMTALCRVKVNCKMSDELL